MSECERMTNKLRDHLALFVGANKKHSVEEVSAATGIGVDSLRAYLRGERQPNAENLLRLMAALGPHFATAVLAPAGYRAEEVAADDGDDPNQKRALSKMLSTAAMHAKMLEDGRLDHVEKRHLAPDLRDTGCALIAAAAQLDAETQQ